MSRTKQTKARRRTGSIFLAALVLVASSTAAEAHPASPGAAVPDSAGTIHTCYPSVGLPILSGLPILGPLISSLISTLLPDEGTLRVVTPTEPCIATLSLGPLPIVAFENSVDWPASGVLTRLVETPPSALPLTLPPGPGQTGSINVTCPTGKVALGLAVFSTTAPTAPATLVGTSRSGSTLTATFANLFAAPATISNIKALCVTLFAP